MWSRPTCSDRTELQMSLWRASANEIRWIISLGKCLFTGRLCGVCERVCKLWTIGKMTTNNSGFVTEGGGGRAWIYFENQFVFNNDLISNCTPLQGKFAVYWIYHSCPNSFELLFIISNVRRCNIHSSYLSFRIQSERKRSRFALPSIKRAERGCYSLTLWCLWIDWLVAQLQPPKLVVVPWAGTTDIQGHRNALHCSAARTVRWQPAGQSTGRQVSMKVNSK